MRVDDLEERALETRQQTLDKKKKVLISLSIVFVVSIVIIILWIFLFKKSTYIRTYKDETFSFKYDTTWKITQEKDNIISLTHKTKSIIDIKISALPTNYINNDISIVVDEVKFDIEKQNVGYKLLKEEKSIISENKYEAYKLLYEGEDSQSLIVVIKNDNCLFVINYISKNEFFDILLDSFQLVLGSLKFE